MNKLRLFASSAFAMALVMFSQITMNSSWEVALEAADTNAIGWAITSWATSLVNMALSLLPYIIGLTVVIIIYRKISGFGKLRR